MEELGNDLIYSFKQIYIYTLELIHNKASNPTSCTLVLTFKTSEGSNPADKKAQLLLAAGWRPLVASPRTAQTLENQLLYQGFLLKKQNKTMT